ncbi:MAG: sigma-70 family RNA polymerase sigma factor [Croceibacterium sp.]
MSDDLVLTGRGDRKAFRRVYSTVAGKLLAICNGVVRDRAAAEDILQEVFIKIWRSAPSYDPARASAMSWLCTIARNGAIDWYRARAKKPVMMTDEKNFQLVSEDEPADERIIREQNEVKAFAMVDDLKGEEEEDLKAIYFQGLTYVEAAEQHGVPLGTLKSRVRRAVAKMRLKYNDE